MQHVRRSSGRGPPPPLPVVDQLKILKSQLTNRVVWRSDKRFKISAKEFASIWMTTTATVVWQLLEIFWTKYTGPQPAVCGALGTGPRTEKK